MSLHQFISEILNINSEDIEDLLQISQSDGSILIKVKLVVKPTSCPYCKGPVFIHGYTSKHLKHSVLANRNCIICFYRRRYRCKSCCISFSEANPFSFKNENLTHETKINILKDLKKPGETYTIVAHRYNVSVQTVLRIFDKHVNIERKIMPEVLSLDEHYFPNSDFDSIYCTLLMDFRTGELIDVLPDRKKIHVTKYFSDIKYTTTDQFTKRSELDNVKYISIDLYDNFRDIFRNLIPNAIICADSFHVLKHLTEDFDRVRKACYRSTENEVLKNLLIKFRFVFNHTQFLDNEGKYNRALGRYVNYRQIMDILFENFPELKVAYNLKELYIMYNSIEDISVAAEKFDAIKQAFEDSGIEQYDEFITILNNWKQEIINSFTRIDGRRVNNSYIESKNRQIEHLMNNANGFVNFQRTRNRILYCLNKSDTYLF